MRLCENLTADEIRGVEEVMRSPENVERLHKRWGSAKADHVTIHDVSPPESHPIDCVCWCSFAKCAEGCPCRLSNEHYAAEVEGLLPGHVGVLHRRVDGHLILQEGSSVLIDITDLP